MLEIKCPPKRKFSQKSAIPKGYWYQMQSQLECTDLEECDFLQVKFKEYTNEIEFEADNMKIDEKIEFCTVVVSVAHRIIETDNQLREAVQSANDFYENNPEACND